MLGMLELYNIIEFNELLPKMINFGLFQAIFQLSLLFYAYSTNEQLRKFVFEMYASCFY